MLNRNENIYFVHISESGMIKIVINILIMKKKNLLNNRYVGTKKFCKLCQCQIIEIFVLLAWHTSWFNKQNYIIQKSFPAFKEK